MTPIEKIQEYLKNIDFELERLPKTYRFANGHHVRYQECQALAETLERSVARLSKELDGENPRPE